MRGVFSDNGTAWPSCLGWDWVACCSQSWAEWNEINVRKKKKASRWIMNWHSLCFLWLLHRSTEVASRTTTWLQRALRQMRHSPSFIRISLCSKCCKMTKRCTKNWTITCMQRIYKDLISLISCWYWFDGGSLKTLNGRSCVWNDLTPHKYHPKAIQ